MDVSRGLIDWVNTFSLSHHADSLDELSDGVALFEIMAEIDPARFDVSTVKTNAGQNWVLKETNLKRLHKLVLQYYEEHLGQAPSTFDAVDLKAIAATGSEAELVKLTQMVLGCVVQSENNQQYIERITTLEQSSQGVLMIMIQEVMAKSQRDGGGGGGGAGAAQDVRARSFSAASDSAMESFRADYQQMQREKAELQKERDELLKRVNKLEREKDDLVEEREDLRHKVHELEEAAAHTREASREKQDSLFKSETDSLHAEIAESERKRAEAEKTVSKQAGAINDLTKKADALAKQAEEAAGLKERVEELRHVASKLERAEAAIEKYKQKLEEAAEAKKQLRSVQVERDELASKAKDLEELVSRNSGSKTQISALREHVQTLEGKVRDLDMEQTRLAYEAEKYKSESDTLREENLKYRDQLEELQAKVQELEVTGETLGPMLDRRLSSGGGLGGGIATEIYEKQVAELKVKVSKLERDNQLLRSSSTADSSEKEATLNSMLDEAKQTREALEQSLREETHKALRFGDQVKSLEKKLQEVETRQINMTFKANENDLIIEQLATAERESKALQVRVNEADAQLSESQRRLRVVEEALQERQKEVVSLRSELHLTSKDKKEMLDEFRTQVTNEVKDKIETAERALAERKAALEELSQRHDELKRELAQAHEDLKAQDEANKHLIISVNALQSEKLVLLEQKLETTEGKARDRDTDEAAKKLELAAQKIMSIQEEKAQLQKALKKAKMYIEAQEKKIKEQAIRLTELTDELGSASQSNFPEAVRSLETMLAQREQEVETLERTMKEQREAFKKEQRMMVTAWYSLGLQIKQKGAAKKEKASWLGQQRQARQLNRATPVKTPGAGHL